MVQELVVIEDRLGVETLVPIGWQATKNHLNHCEKVYH